MKSRSWRLDVACRLVLGEVRHSQLIITVTFRTAGNNQDQIFQELSNQTHRLRYREGFDMACRHVVGEARHSQLINTVTFRTAGKN